MTNIIKSLLNIIINDNDSESIITKTIIDSKDFLYNLAIKLNEHGKHEASQDICFIIINNNPKDPKALYLSVENYSKLGKIDKALERLLTIRNLGIITDEFAHLVYDMAKAATISYSYCMSSGDVEQATNIVNILVELCPGAFLFQKAKLETHQALQKIRYSSSLNMLKDNFETLCSLIDTCQKSRDFVNEVQLRTELFNHPLARVHHSALRIQNISAIVSRLIGADLSKVSSDNILIAKNLLMSIPSIPATPSATENLNDDTAACFDRFYRTLLGSIDLDMVFGPPVEASPFLPTIFVSSIGSPMDIAAVAKRGYELEARVVFFPSSSPEYLDRYGKSYVTSILNACDCSCMIIICVCCPNEEIVELSRSIGIDDDRLIFCSDNYKYIEQNVNIIFPNKGDTGHTPTYYACASLFRTDYILRHLGIPVITTGIDTVLQTGISDLIDRFKGYDLVLNKIGSHYMLGSQVVNSLVMVFPTELGIIFLNFIKKYMGDHLLMLTYAAFIDQLDLHMALHHSLANGASPMIGFFDEHDINNAMFSKSNHIYHVDKMKKYRFLNMFVGGGLKDPLSVKDVELVIS